LLSLVPLNLFARWSQGIFIIGVSGIMKLRLLARALRIDTDQARQQGVGQHLARVLESESLEALTLAGGFYALTGGFELLLAGMVFLIVDDTLQLALLVIMLLALAAMAWIYFQRR
jgi:hypothetical protein